MTCVTALDDASAGLGPESFYMTVKLSTAVLALAGLTMVGTQWYTVFTIRDLARRVETVDRRTRPQEAPPLPAEPLPLRGAPTKGSWSAHVALLEYSDFHCTFCTAFARDTLPQLEQDYVATGKVLFAFRHLPIEELHPHAVAAARAAACAAEQNRFWPMHDWLFHHDKGRVAVRYNEHASELGLAPEAFASCMTTSGAAAVTADIASAAPLRIVGTPTFFVGELRADGTMLVKERIRGAIGVDGFRQSLDKALSGSPTAKLLSR